MKLNQIAAAACITAASAAAWALPTAFVGTDLSQIVSSHYGASFSTEMLGLNNLSQVLGRTSTRDSITREDTDRTFLITGGALTEIGAFNTSRGIGTGIYGRGFNNLGDVVGNVFTAGTGTERVHTPALYSGGTVSTLSLPFTRGFASLISDTGHIAGSRVDPATGRPTNFLLRGDGSYAEFLQGRFGEITGITSGGTVVGWDNLLGRGSLGYTFNGTSLTYPLEPSNPADAENGRFEMRFSAVNDAGHIAATLRQYIGQSCYDDPFAGTVCFDNHTKEAGTVQGAGFTPAPDLSIFSQNFGTVTSARVNGINNRGTLIGYDDFRQSAFLSDGTTTVTLNDPRRIGSSNFYGDLIDINDADQLLGRVNGSGNPWVLLNPVGVNAQAPLLPAEQTPTADGGTAFTFTVFVAPATPLFFDPPVAIGYEYEIQSGPSFASVLLPDIGDGKYRLELWNGSAWVDAGIELEAGVSFDFLAQVSPDGVRKFRVVGIETSAALDPDDPTAFDTGLTYNACGELTLTQTSLSVDVPAVPEPGAVVLLGLGLAIVARAAQHKRRNTTTHDLRA